MEQPKNAKLSKAVLDMKFMKKSKERVEKEEDNAEGQAMYSSEITEEMRKSGNVNFIETSIVHCKQLIDGRLSFGGMNTQIENLMSEDYHKKLNEIDTKKEKEISDAEMANKYSSLVNTISNKFTKKRDRQGNKMKFLKPSED